MVDMLAKRGKVSVAVDTSGVGAPVRDLLRKQGLRFKACVITRGEMVSEKRGNVYIAKQELVSYLIKAFQTGELKIAAGLEPAQSTARLPPA